MVVPIPACVLVALDRPEPEQARNLIRDLAPLGCGFKVGLTLLPLLGERELAEMTALGGKLFLDYKLHDIAETVAGAVRTICCGEAAFLTVHAELPVMRAAVAAKGDHELKLLGVTVLSSLDDSDVYAAGYRYGVKALAIQRAKAAKDVGMDGLICAPHEVAALREIVGAEMCLITPGVRPEGSVLNDQKRVMTPRDAMLSGADYLVIGRPIVAAPDPVRALADIIETLLETAPT
ncbi:MAG: orotidine-5'-phosphate decarboxylase [Alphaproteobacteria bacterium]|nr:orotidine-5'-phosphate decarboxylase [Alphaproteobacteria bacterium]